MLDPQASPFHQRQSARAAGGRKCAWGRRESALLWLTGWLGMRRGRFGGKHRVGGTMSVRFLRQ